MEKGESSFCDKSTLIRLNEIYMSAGLDIARVEIEFIERFLDVLVDRIKDSRGWGSIESYVKIESVGIRAIAEEMLKDISSAMRIY